MLRQFLTGGLTSETEDLASAETPAPPTTGSAIHPIIIGDEEGAMDLSHSLQNEGFLAPAIRYPTVAKGAARLRITVTAAHEEAQIRALAGALSRLRPEALT